MTPHSVNYSTKWASVFESCSTNPTSCPICWFGRHCSAFCTLAHGLMNLQVIMSPDKWLSAPVYKFCYSVCPLWSKGSRKKDSKLGTNTTAFNCAQMWSLEKKRLYYQSPVLFWWLSKEIRRKNRHYRRRTSHIHIECNEFLFPFLILVQRICWAINLGWSGSDRDPGLASPWYGAFHAD